MSLGLGALMLPSAANASGDMGLLIIPLILGFVAVPLILAVILAAAAAGAATLFTRKWNWLTFWLAFAAVLGIGIVVVVSHGPDAGLRWLSYLQPASWISQPRQFSQLSVDEKIRASHGIVLLTLRVHGEDKFEVVAEYLKGERDPNRYEGAQIGMRRGDRHIYPFDANAGYVRFHFLNPSGEKDDYAPRHENGRIPSLENMTLDELRKRVQEQK